MRAIVTDEQRRNRADSGLPSADLYVTLSRDDLLKQGRALLRGERRRFSVTMSRIAPSSLLVAPQNRPAKSKGICGTRH
jgi:hypothetical protein